MAKIYIVHDHEGKILAASEFENHGRPLHHEGKIASGARVRPEMRPGVRVGEFEIPAKFVEKKMHEYIPLLKVDITTQRLKEK